jgi:ABC-type multidrug transport system permease subunit
MPVFLREHFNGMYRVDVYFLCKTLAEVPLFAALPVIFTSITYYLVGLNPSFFRFFVANVVVMLVANVAVSFGKLKKLGSIHRVARHHRPVDGGSRHL